MTDFIDFVIACWPGILIGAYVGQGLKLAAREAVLSRREGADGPIWPTLAVVTALWPLLYAQRAVFALILAWDVLAVMRAERREMREARRG